MSYWKCRHCNCKNEDSHKCKHCNSHKPKESEREESSTMNTHHHHHNNHDNNTDVLQDSDMLSFVDQESDEVIWIKDSINIDVHTTDTQAAISLQVGLQLAIALVVSITIGDSDHGRKIAQDIFQKFDSEQTNKQKIFIKNSKDCEITTSDTDISVNIQALLQVLVSLVAKIDIA